MGFDVLAILFIVFSILSSLYNRWQTRRADAEREETTNQRVARERAVRDREAPVLEEESEDDFDLLEWMGIEPEDSLEEPEREVQPKASGQPALPSLVPAAPVPSSVTSPTPVQASPKEEFRPPEIDSASKHSATSLRRQPIAPRRRRRAKVLDTLQFNRNGIVQGMLYAEILGPPRGDRPIGAGWE